MPNTFTSPPPRIRELDGIRGLAILLVLLYHYVAVPIPPDASAGLLFLRQLFSNTWSGVDLFFVLSGFLIAGILIDNKAASNYFQVFYTRRVTRIFPLYYFFLSTFLLLRLISPRVGIFSEALFASPLPMLPYFLYLQNVAMAVQGTFGNEFLAMTWSLAIEEHFYLLLPLVVWRSRSDRLPFNLLFLIAISLILRATLARGTYFAFVLTPWRLDGLFLGALLAVLFRTPILLNVLKTRLLWIKIACVALLLYIAYSSMTEPLGSLDHLLTFGLFYASLIFLSLAESTSLPARLLRRPWLMNIGKVSYGIYLFHQMANGIVHDLFFNRPPRFDSLPTVLATLLALLLVYLLAQGTYHAFEKQFIAFGHRYSYSND